MKTASLGDKIATTIYWLLAFLVVGPLTGLLLYRLFLEFVLWEAVIAAFCVAALAFGARQCYQVLRGKS